MDESPVPGLIVSRNSMIARAGRGCRRVIGVRRIVAERKFDTPTGRYRRCQVPRAAMMALWGRHEKTTARGLLGGRPG
ncbi:hypothetical protein D0Q02_06460 [Micromonospora craniellae]|uniref:Uncharacterized protein n=1 Tax=Micromonospora craniellae TaxID=2294034 RepID=A0A372G2P2_9ACTN|nr:hypothetical protein D0Q02_06460 [Micromonospora craniellae]